MWNCLWSFCKGYTGSFLPLKPSFLFSSYKSSSMNLWFWSLHVHQLQPFYKFKWQTMVVLTVKSNLQDQEKGSLTKLMHWKMRMIIAMKTMKVLDVLSALRFVHLTLVCVLGFVLCLWTFVSFFCPPNCPTCFLCCMCTKSVFLSVCLLD